MSIIVNPSNPLAGAVGVPAAFIAGLNSYDTGFSSQAGTGMVGAVCCKTGTANQILIITPATASPFIKADLYDSNLRKLTALTISGALVEALSSSNFNEGVYLVWSTEQSKWYLKSANTSVHKVYPLSLSGTTLTIAAAIDISGTYAAANADNVAMCGDDTDLWFIDLSGNNGPRKYDVSASSMGSAQLAPTNTNYYQASSSVLPNHKWVGSSTKLWLISSSAANGYFTVFQEYSIAGNTWTDKGVPSQLLSISPSLCYAGCDPLSPTYLYFVNFWSSSNTVPQAEPALIKWKISTNKANLETPLYAGSGSFSPSGSSNLSTNYLPGPAVVPAVNESSVNSIMVSETNNDIVFVRNNGGPASAGAQNVYNFGKKWGRKTVFDYSGSGYFHGLGGLKGFASGSSATLTGGNTSANIAYVLTVDGTEKDPICLGSVPIEECFKNNVPFATSLKVEVYGTFSFVTSGSGSGVGQVQVKATITS